MSIENSEMSALGSPNSGLAGPAPMTRVAKRRYHKVITKILVSAAIVLGSGVAGAAPASAGPDTVGTPPNPFAGFGCSCQETAPAGSPALREEIDRGLREGHTAVLPGLPAPVQAGPPLP